VNISTLCSHFNKKSGYQSLRLSADYLLHTGRYLWLRDEASLLLSACSASWNVMGEDKYKLVLGSPFRGRHSIMSVRWSHCRQQPEHDSSHYTT
jgi:hypothetical protein